MEDLVGGQKLEMNVNRWLHEKKDDGDIVREIPVVWPGEEPAPGGLNQQEKMKYMIRFGIFS